MQGDKTAAEAVMRSQQVWKESSMLLYWGKRNILSGAHMMHASLLGCAAVLRSMQSAERIWE